MEALLRLDRGDRAGAQRALRTGLGLLEGYRETLGASDLRATASEIGVELSQLGLRIALAGADADSVLAWADRLRGSALRLPPVTPPDVPELRDRAAELRRVSAEIWRAERGKRGTRTLLARQATLEASIRRLSRHAAGEPAPGNAPPGAAFADPGAGHRRARRADRARRHAHRAHAGGRAPHPSYARTGRAGLRRARVAALRARAAGAVEPERCSASRDAARRQGIGRERSVIGCSRRSRSASASGRS